MSLTFQTNASQVYSVACIGRLSQWGLMGIIFAFASYLMNKKYNGCVSYGMLTVIINGEL